MSASDPILTYVPPLLCTQAERPPVGASCVREIKFDGYRIELAVNGGRASLFSKNGLDWTHRFPELALEASALPDCLLDGEMVALDEHGRSDFERLLAALSSRRTSSLVFYAFDALSIAGQDLRALPYSKRKRRLEGLLELCDGPACDHIAVVESHAVEGRTMLEAARGLELEGIVSKRLDAPYQSGRPQSWIKTKLRPTEEVVIGGWTTTSGADLAALLAGVWRDGELTYVGRVGTGFGGKAGTTLSPSLGSLLSRARLSLSARHQRRRSRTRSGPSWWPRSRSGDGSAARCARPASSGFARISRPRRSKLAAFTKPSHPDPASADRVFVPRLSAAGVRSSNRRVFGTAHPRLVHMLSNAGKRAGKT
jgi:DNA ligase D-like protein (predicted ligase)